MANVDNIGPCGRGSTPRRTPVAACKTRIQDHSFELDAQATFDIRLALSEYHGRLCRAVGDSLDMNESSKLAATLITVRLAHDTIAKDY